MRVQRWSAAWWAQAAAGTAAHAGKSTAGPYLNRGTKNAPPPTCGKVAERAEHGDKLERKSSCQEAQCPLCRHAKLREPAQPRLWLPSAASRRSPRRCWRGQRQRRRAVARLPCACPAPAAGGLRPSPHPPFCRLRLAGLAGAAGAAAAPGAANRAQGGAGLQSAPREGQPGGGRGSARICSIGWPAWGCQTSASRSAAVGYRTRIWRGALWSLLAACSKGMGKGCAL